MNPVRRMSAAPVAPLIGPDQVGPVQTGMVAPMNNFVDPATGNLTGVSYRFLYNLHAGIGMLQAALSPADGGFWKWNAASIVGDIADGTAGLNPALPSLVVSANPNHSVSLAQVLGIVQGSDGIIVWDMTDPTRTQRYAVAGPPSLSGSTWSIPVAGGSGVAPNDGDDVHIEFRLR